MIEITVLRAGTCDSCKQRPSEYLIQGEKDEWTVPNRVCQPCMLGMVRNSEYVRSVLILQGGVK